MLSLIHSSSMTSRCLRIHLPQLTAAADDIIWERAIFATAASADTHQQHIARMRSRGWLVFDMRGGATPADNLSDPQLLQLSPILYGFSVHVCLPSGAS